MESACGIDNKNVRAAVSRVVCRIVNDCRGVASLGLLYELNIGSLAPFGKLIDRCRAEGIGCSYDNLFAFLAKSV